MRQRRIDRILQVPDVSWGRDPDWQGRICGFIDRPVRGYSREQQGASLGHLLSKPHVGMSAARTAVAPRRAAPRGRRARTMVVVSRVESRRMLMSWTESMSREDSMCVRP